MARTMKTITIEDSNGDLVVWDFADTETRDRTAGISGLAQEDGDSESLVMSQKAVTDLVESQEAQTTPGANGYTFTPSVSAEGVISWTNDGGLANPSPVNIKGPQGERGLQGVQGERGPAGEAGYSPIRGTDYWTDADKAEIKSYVDDAILGGKW